MQITSVNCERETIEMTSAAGEPDPAWLHQDVLGQVHRWHGHDLPTLERRVSGTWTDEDGELHESWDWRVPATGERVEPRMHRYGECRFIQGLITMSGQLVTHEWLDPDVAHEFKDCGLRGKFIVTAWVSRGVYRPERGPWLCDWVASGPVEVVDA